MYKSDPFGYRQTNDLIIPGLGTKKRTAQCATVRRTTASNGSSSARSTSVKNRLLGKNTREGTGAVDGDFSYYLSQLQEERAKGDSRAPGGDAGIVLLIGDSDRNSSNVLLFGPGDEDGDGITNGGEELLGTDPLRSDTDRDGVDDLSEVGDPRSPLDHHRDGVLDALDPENDSDCDGVSNSKEKRQGSSALDPFDPGPPSPSFGCEEGAALPRTGVDVGMITPPPLFAAPHRASESLRLRSSERFRCQVP